MAAGVVTTVEHILDSRNSTLYNGAPNKNPIVEAQVAQSVEHCTENAGVGGSIPPLGTTRTTFRFGLCSPFAPFSCRRCRAANSRISGTLPSTLILTSPRSLPG